MYIPIASLKRMPKYLDLIIQLKDDGHEWIKSEVIAAELDLAGSSVRRDLSFISEGGVRGWGYEIEPLIKAIKNTIGNELEAKVGIIGMGNFGSAFAKYNSRKRHCAKIVAGFDISENKIGTEISGIKVYSFDDIEKIIDEQKIKIMIITTPDNVTQNVFDRCVAAGVKGYMNFSSEKIKNKDRNIHIKPFDMEYVMNELIFKLKK